jgi:hypothetical protein
MVSGIKINVTTVKWFIIELEGNNGNEKFMLLQFRYSSDDRVHAQCL